MATFTPDEIDFLKARGNDYCRNTYLGLLDTQPPTKDEQQIKDFMIAKYELKRYYLDPAIASTFNKPTVNGSSTSPSRSSTSSHTDHTNIEFKALPNKKAVLPAPTSLSFKAPTQINNNNVFTPEPFADFNNLSIPPPCDPFNSSQSAAAPSTQSSFANFDNNPVFNNSNSTGMPSVGEAGTVPGEDRYAALKDLDCLMKTQHQQHQEQQQQQQQAAEPVSAWDAGMTNGITNVWSAPTLFPTTNATTDFGLASNPFKGDGMWNNAGANPFRNTRPLSTEGMWSCVSNGQSNGFTTSQSLNFSGNKVFQGNDAISNPFAIGTSLQTTGHHSSNPFL